MRAFFWPGILGAAVLAGFDDGFLPRRVDAWRKWRDAYELLDAADRRGELEPDALELLAECARWTGRIEDVFDPLERAHAAYAARGDRRAAVRTALALCLSNGDASRPSVATAWWRRADGLILDLPEGPEHALHAWFQAQTHAWSGQVDEQGECAERALALARRFGDRDVEALALVELAHVASTRGEASAAEKLDRAISLALGGEIGILSSGMVFCSSIWACRCRGDWQRAQ
jgi:tetratricopeptide (TPR) repeat protein